MKWGKYWKRELYCADYKTIFLGIILHFICGILSALLGGSASIYRYLVLPHFAPPPFVFVLIWTVLYLLLGVALGIYLSSYECSRSRWNLNTCILYGVFLLTLFLWYPIFFGARLFSFALVVIAAIISVSLFVFRYFIRRSRLAAFLLLPCMICFVFFFFLNFCILLLN
ncbi:MAG: tryptophan-rich sensory protein [Clostridia bacterium]|nr:tryptophan-rich sensory protein [Clostridia bacterium]